MPKGIPTDALNDLEIQDKICILVVSAINGCVRKEDKNCVIDAINILLQPNSKKYPSWESSLNIKSHISLPQLFSELSHINEKQQRRKKEGVYYTPDDVTDFIVSNSFLNYVDDSITQVYTSEVCKNKIIAKSPRDIESIIKAKVLDPTCGTGEFLTTALQIKMAIAHPKDDLTIMAICNSLYGNDIASLSTDIAKVRLFFTLFEKLSNKDNCTQVARTLNRHFSNEDFVPSKENCKERYDIIVGNPPYVEYSKADGISSNNYGNIYADVLHNCSYLLKKNGVLGFVIPLSYVSTSRMWKLREKMADALKKEFVMNFADRPDCLFDSVHQKLTILIGNGGVEECKYYTSGYYYWNDAERKSLFDKVSVCENTVVEKDFIPKIENELEKSIYTKITNKGTPLFEFLKSKGNTGKSLHLNMRACFWMKCFSFNPGSNEYEEFKVEESVYHYLLCLLNSSLFFFCWNVISDCWHITQKELKCFKVRLGVGDLSQFTDLAKALETKLDQTKKYIGSKQVDYEYKHRDCKAEIDAIDNALQTVYELTDTELTYVKNYILRYRISSTYMNVIDLFAGCGGFSVGFKKAGFKITKAVEINEEIAESYKYNHRDTLVYPNDIGAIDNEKFFSRNEAEVIVGGPPCQGFSMAGARIRSSNAFIDDPRNFLFRHYINVVKLVLPKAFVLENVKGILSKDKGAIFNEIVNAFGNPDNFDGNKYYLHYKVVRAVEYGIPQQRERVVLIGCLNKDFDIDLLFEKAKEQIIKDDKHFFDKVSLADAISDLGEPTINGTSKLKKCKTDYQKLLRSDVAIVQNHIRSHHNDIAVSRMERVGNGENWTVLNEDIHSVHSGAYGRLEWDKPTMTITTRFDTPSGGRFTHPTENRTLTPREAARVQSFPDDFVFTGSKTSVCKQIGNAVPPKLAYFLANVVKNLTQNEQLK
ncbi:MAG: DNA (cytosine-5-)-methyltransferase [Paludibacteraceae bacterium]|nr:DNA (cytosine-5-)-methyltransferase [Paludibacteraceae bacterium]